MSEGPGRVVEEVEVGACAVADAVGDDGGGDFGARVTAATCTMRGGGSDVP
jgi:hypothetical protein